MNRLLMEYRDKNNNFDDNFEVVMSNYNSTSCRRQLYGCLVGKGKTLDMA